MPEDLCPCQSEEVYSLCCQPFHLAKSKPETAEELMRSRYAAFALRLVDYLVETTHPSARGPRLKWDLEKNIHDATWVGLDVLKTTGGGSSDKTGKVEFVAKCRFESNPEILEMREHSRFRRFGGEWKYLDGKG